MSSDKLINFMDGISATTQLANRAAELGCFTEYVVLGAALVDGLLRIALVLNHQLNTESKEIPEELIYQSDDDQFIHEREIFRRTREEEIIDPDIFDRLNDLYDERNRVVHRYIISSITTEEILHIAIRWSDMVPQILESVSILENKQIELGIGMTEEAQIPSIEEEINKMLDRKHGDEEFASILDDNP